MPDDDGSKNISVRLPADTYAKLTEHQKKLERKIGGVDLSISAVVRRLIEEGLGMKASP